MNLPLFQRGNRFFIRLMFRVADRMEAEGLPDVVRVLFVHSNFFGQPFARYVHEAICGPSDWTRAERELIAAAVSRANECPFCFGAHTGVAAAAADDTSFASFGNTTHSQHREELVAALAYVRKLAQDPKSVTKEDVATLKAKGLTTEMIETTVHICTAFSVINRLANGFRFTELTTDGYRRSGKLLSTLGYKWIARAGATLERLP